MTARCHCRITSRAFISNTVTAPWPGKYQLALDLTANEKYVDNVFDYNKCRLIFQVDGKELLREDYNREGDRHFHYDFDQDWAAGGHVLSFQLQPLTPDQEQTRTLHLQLHVRHSHRAGGAGALGAAGSLCAVLSERRSCRAKARRAYAKELLGSFARKAFRRPVDDKTADKLAGLAERVYSQPGKTFEAGVAEGMVAVLASPQFLFREEAPDPLSGKERYPFVDEYSLASRLSYFLWTSMPDDELFRLAGEGRLRQNLSEQVARMLKDKKSEAFVRDFTGQWLRGRDIEDWPIDARSILSREEKFDPERDRLRQRFRQLNDKSDESLTQAQRDELANIRATLFKNFKRPPRVNFNGELRTDMRLETEKVFDYVLRQDRSLLELLDSDYTFLNHRLAVHYGITNVTGDEMRLVALPPDSLRGGVLTEGTVLVVTSNPTRTSPVKRGLFILDSISGHAAAAASAQHSAVGRRGQRLDQSRALLARNSGVAPQGPAVQFVPQPDGPVGPGL